MKSKCKVLKPPEDGAPADLLGFYEWAAEKKIDCKTTFIFSDYVKERKLIFDFWNETEIWNKNRRIWQVFQFL